MPLPLESHLKKVCKGLKCPYGVNTNAVNAISEFLREKTDENRGLRIVIFNKVKLREEIEFNATSLKVDGFVGFSDYIPCLLYTSRCV